MKKTILIALAICSSQVTFSQTSAKSYSLYVVAEGNFGTPNGDIYNVTSNGTTQVQSGPLYAQANSTVGIDVLQDYETFGNKAVLISKGGSGQKIVVTSFPGFVQQEVITGFSPQCIVKVSNRTAYIGGAATSAVKKIDLVTGVMTAITDPSGFITSAVTNMVYANGNVYIAYTNKLVKIDTVTATAVNSFTLGITGLTDILYDQAQQHIWAIGKVSSTISLVKVDVTNNDFVNTPNQLTGITTGGWLRQYHDSLFFLSGKKVYAVNNQNVQPPTAPIYTSTLTGSWDFAYGKAFYVDPNSGDFVIGSANAFTGPSLYEIIDGHTGLLIDAGNVAGKGVNEFVLETRAIDNTAPVANVASLPVANGQCSVTVNAPTATDNLSGIITGTTTAPLNYTAQGTYTLNWTYTDGAGNSSTQTQTVIVHDQTAPVPNVAALPSVTVQCLALITAPTANDNCAGTITGTTTAALTYSVSGTQIISWTYNDGHGNISAQIQTVVVSCAVTGIEGYSVAGRSISIYPNPANDVCNIQLVNASSDNDYTLSVTDQLGRTVHTLQFKGNSAQIETTHLQSGIYYISLLENGTLKQVPGKLIITH